ncbi:MAG TPA: LacI family DNA-binding transcriptional regulator [Chloroflexota bacterium]|nr:LacI family DNA-binding transcriptional regulator [Chloroflexota bacterium]
MDDPTGTADKEAPRAAMRDIAALAGVSIATVSRVLNGRPDVSPRTRDLVLRQIRQLGYVSSRTVTTPAGGRTGLIGLTVPYLEVGYFLMIIAGVCEALYERDARVVLSPTLHEHEREVTVLQRLMHRVTDGTLLILPSETKAELRQLRQLGAPFVVIDPGTPLDDNIPVVAAANWSGARMATEHLIALGHRRIGLITGPKELCASVDRTAGYHSALLAGGLPIVPELTREANFHLEGGCEAAHDLLSLPDRPTAIFAINDNMAIGVMRAARERGLDIPRQLSVVGFDDIDIAVVAYPALTTVSQPLQEMGRLAVSVLYRQINGQALEAHRIELSTRLVVRGSTAPPG